MYLLAHTNPGFGDYMYVTLTNILYVCTYIHAHRHAHSMLVQALKAMVFYCYCFCLLLLTIKKVHFPFSSQIIDGLSTPNVTTIYTCTCSQNKEKSKIECPDQMEVKSLYHYNHHTSSTTNASPPILMTTIHTFMYYVCTTCRA